MLMPVQARILSEIHEEFDQVRFLRADCLANLEGSFDFILAKASASRHSDVYMMQVNTVN
jgi:hypothetical protein